MRNDHPVIWQLEHTGYPDGEFPPRYRCPRCGEDCREFYLDWNDDICGCNECLRAMPGEDYEELFVR